MDNDNDFCYDEPQVPELPDLGEHPRLTKEVYGATFIAARGDGAGSLRRPAGRH